MSKDLLEHFTAKYGIPFVKIEAKEQDIYRIEIDSSIDFFLFFSEKGILLQGTIAPFGYKDRFSLCKLLMKANYLFQGTGDGQFGIDPEEKFISYSRYISHAWNDSIFQERVEEFSNWLDYWKEEIKKIE